MSQMTSTARVGARALNRPATTTPKLRVVTGAALRRGDAAFGISCAVLLAAGLIGLLLLNTALAQGSFTLHDLRASSDQLTDLQDALNQSVQESRSPANLAAEAVAMGMVPGRSAAFLRLSDGAVVGVATPAPALGGFTVVKTTAIPTPTATATATASAPATAKATATATAPTTATAPATAQATAPAAATARPSAPPTAKAPATAPVAAKPAKR
jgi:cytoskeletal protein RodZ